MKRILILLAAVSLATAASAQDWARAALEKSPRHREWVRLKVGRRELACFVVYPEVKNKATAVVLIHEIFGLTDWARSVADQLAAAGYVVVAPDLLSGMGPAGGNSDAFASQEAALKAVSELPAGQVTADLNAAVGEAGKLPAANGKVVVAGFCWGGGQAFRLATNNQLLKSAFVFYGPGPEDAAAVARINCPVYGFYAGNDARITATLPQTIALMKQAGKTYEPVTYEDAGHGFMRSGEAPDATPANEKARAAAWARFLGLLKKF